MGLQVLIVDDNENISTLLKDVVTLEDHIGTIAYDGTTAQTLLDEQSFDVAFCDITLPDKSGWEVVAALRKRSPETKIIVISGMGNAIDQEKLEKFQVEGTVKKPFQITDIQDALRNL